MWVLLLNDMRASNIENIQPCFRAESKEQLRAFLEAESVDGYKDGQWSKAYRQGGPLEWCNPPWDHDDHLHFQDAGTEDDWANNVRQNYQGRKKSCHDKNLGALVCFGYIGTFGIFSTHSQSSLEILKIDRSSAICLLTVSVA